ncbi:hypothetical protein FOZ60_014977 [Perkinsus olseni]|uniref:Uncharacterized protein n=1 Tax=Perkinsus olseni TaxID=32597 RepID=A0A7J6N6G9_PEROL|nr:hypothetical protein FOZ60_014977 [Perkinsus olseni]
MTNTTQGPAPASSSNSSSGTAIDPLVLLGAQLLSSVSVKTEPPGAAPPTLPKAHFAPFLIAAKATHMIDPKPTPQTTDRPLPPGTVPGGEGVAISRSAGLVALPTLPPHPPKCMRCHAPWELRQQKTGFMKKTLLPVLRCTVDKTRNHDLWLYDGNWVSRWQKRRKLGSKEKKMIEEAIANGEVPPIIPRRVKPVVSTAVGADGKEKIDGLLTVKPKQKFANRLCLLLADKTTRCKDCDFWLRGVKVKPDHDGNVVHQGRTWCHLLDKSRKIGDTLRKYRCSETGERLVVARNPCGTCLWAGLTSAPEKYSTVPLRDIKPIPPIHVPKEQESETAEETVERGVVDSRFAPFNMYEDETAALRGVKATRGDREDEEDSTVGLKLQRTTEEGFSLDRLPIEKRQLAEPSLKWESHENNRPPAVPSHYRTIVPDGLASLGDESPRSSIFRIDTPGGCSTPSFPSDVSPLMQPKPSATTKDPVRALEDLILNEDS